MCHQPVTVVDTVDDDVDTVGAVELPPGASVVASYAAISPLHSPVTSKTVGRRSLTLPLNEIEFNPKVDSSSTGTAGGPAGAGGGTCSAAGTCFANNSGSMSLLKGFSSPLNASIGGFSFTWNGETVVNRGILSNLIPEPFSCESIGEVSN